MDPILGQIILWPVPWVPQGWMLCDGRELPISQYSALYSLIGVTYGGNGTTTFKLPDLRNRVALGTQTMSAVGTAGGATNSSITATGNGSLTIGVANLPAHAHPATFTPSGAASVSVAVPAVSNPSTASHGSTPGTTVSLATADDPSSGGTPRIYSSDTANTTLKPFSAAVSGGGGTVAVGNTGNGQALPVQVSVPVSVSTMQPSLTLNFIIATEGVYPTRP